MPVEKVHLHEVGALDSIIDIVGAVFGSNGSASTTSSSSPLNVGGGTVHCAHGVFPVPAPATARLLAGVPVYGSGTQSELVTPTGALLVTATRTRFGPLPAMTHRRRSATAPAIADFERHAQRPARAASASATRRRPPTADQRVVVIECEIDDMNPQLFGPLMDRLLAAGALDVFYTPVQMKKSRPGTLVTVSRRPSGARR